MSRSHPLGNLVRALQVALFCEKQQCSTAQGLERLAALEARIIRRRNRREFLALAGMGTLGAVLGSGSGLHAAPKPKSDLRVGIVGAGLAGLACGYELQKQGIRATLHEASDRVGGRCFSLGGMFPNQVAERGGEFIDNLHKTLLGYANEFKLPLEDLKQFPGGVTYYFNGQHYPESFVVDEFRNLVAAMRRDLQTLSSAPTADGHTAADIQLDRTNLREYLETRQAGRVIQAAITAAYMAEYGLEAEAQSCLNFLLFVHADKRSKFRPFGVFSDERYHVIDGNDRIPQELANRLQGQINFGMRLVKVRKNSSNQIELTFKLGAKTVSAVYDAVVLAIPFTVLRQVDLDPSLQLPSWKTQAIQQLGYGSNAKMMVGFQGRPWLNYGSNGSSYSDLLNHQTTWETNPIKATSTQAILTDYSSGDRSKRLNPRQTQTEAMRFLSDLNRVYPNASLSAARQSNGTILAHLEHWPSNPLTLGSYTCYTPGQFTTIAGNEGKPIGNLYFAGEHANSFYEWQGFMEGAALSGVQTASAILQDLKTGALRS